MASSAGCRWNCLAQAYVAISRLQAACVCAPCAGNQTRLHIQGTTTPLPTVGAAGTSTADVSLLLQQSLEVLHSGGCVDNGCSRRNIRANPIAAYVYWGHAERGQRARPLYHAPQTCWKHSASCSAAWTGKQTRTSKTNNLPTQPPSLWPPNYTSQSDAQSPALNSPALLCAKISHLQIKEWLL